MLFPSLSITYRYANWKLRPFRYYLCTKNRSSPNKQQPLTITRSAVFSRLIWSGRYHSAHFRKRHGRVWSTRERSQQPERRVMAVAASRNHWQPSARRHDAADAHFSPSHTPASGPQHVHLNDTSLLLFPIICLAFFFCFGRRRRRRGPPWKLHQTRK